MSSTAASAHGRQDAEQIGVLQRGEQHDEDFLHLAEIGFGPVIPTSRWLRSAAEIRRGTAPAPQKIAYRFHAAVPPLPSNHCFTILPAEIATFFIKISGPRQREIDGAFFLTRR